MTFTALPPNIIDLSNLESLNLFDNHIEVGQPDCRAATQTIPLTGPPFDYQWTLETEALELGVSELADERDPDYSVVFSMNRLKMLPRGFGSFPVLEVLDLTYNNLKSLPSHFFLLSQICKRRD